MYSKSPQPQGHRPAEVLPGVRLHSRRWVAGKTEATPLHAYPLPQPGLWKHRLRKTSPWGQDGREPLIYSIGNTVNTILIMTLRSDRW